MRSSAGCSSVAAKMRLICCQRCEFIARRATVTQLDTDESQKQSRVLETEPGRQEGANISTFVRLWTRQTKAGPSGARKFRQPFLSTASGRDHSSLAIISR